MFVLNSFMGPFGSPKIEVASAPGSPQTMNFHFTFLLKVFLLKVYIEE